MTAFPIHDPYEEPSAAVLDNLEARDDSDSDSDLELEIDSDVSADELLEYQALLKDTDPDRVQRELADSTRAIQDATMRKWTEYAALHLIILTRRDPE